MTDTDTKTTTEFSESQADYSDYSEFIGQIIDIFEDHLADQDNVLITAALYDRLKEELCTLLSGWNVKFGESDGILA